MRRDGIDVARYQHHIDFAQVAAAGVTWWAHRCSIGTAGDEFRKINRDGAESVPFRARLAYHWLRPDNIAAQAVAFLAFHGSWDGQWRAMCDAEQEKRDADGKLIPGQYVTAAMAAEWCDRVEQTTQVPSAVYTGLYVADGTIWKSARVFNGQRPRILAAYTTEARMRSLVAVDGLGIMPDVWQYLGDAGRCPGVGALTASGPVVDLPCDNDTVLDWTKFDALCGEGVTA